MLFELPPPTTVECPDFGELLIRPYISGGAMSAFRAQEASPQAALDAVIKISIESSQDFDISRLTEADKTVISQALLKSLETFDEFQTNLKTSSLEQAFYSAFTNSETYKSMVKHEKQLESYFDRERKLHGALHGISDFVRQATRFTTIVPTTRFLPDSVARLDLHASMIDRIGMRQDTISKAIESATRHVRSLEIASQQLSAFGNLQIELKASLTTLADIQSIVVPIPKLFENFDLLETRLRGFDLSEFVLGNASDAIESAGLTVQSTNEFFGNSHRPNYGSSRVATEDDDLASDIEQAEVAELEARFLLHEESSDLILVGNDAVNLITERVEQRVDAALEDQLAKYKPLFDRMKLLVNPASFLDVLHDFSELVRREHWKRFWREKGSKFVPAPEALANSLLSIYLGGRWHGTAFVGNELANGDGFMDIVVNFLGINNVVELKMVGAGWGIGHAESGIAQLDQYMANYGEEEAFLVVFDGRKTKTGRILNERYERENGTVNVVTIPIFFEPPTRK